MKNITVGETDFGKVTRKERYGVFVKLGSGQTGLVHINELRGDGDSARSRRHNMLKVGDEVLVDVIGVKDEGARQRVDLSERSVLMDIVFAQLPLGEELLGEVTQVTEYGAFVRLSEWNVSALLHARELRGYGRLERDARLGSLKRGERLSVFVTEVELESGRLRIRCSENEPGWPSEEVYESIPAETSVTH